MAISKRSGAASLAVSTAVLAVASLAGKVLGAVYRIPLTNMLGSEGMGLYQTFFPVYALFVTLTSGALPAVVGRFAAAAAARGEDGSAVFAAARRLSYCLAAAGAAMFAAAALPIARLQSVSEYAAGYALLVPAVAAVALSGAYRGMFLADSGASVCAITQTLEQGVKLIFGLACVFFASKKGGAYAVYGALAAVTVSEFCGYAVLAATFGKKYDFSGVCVDKTLCRHMFSSMLPLLASALVIPLVTFADSFAIVRLLQAGGMDDVQARAQYGVLTGAVGTLINLPVVVALSAAAAALPKLTAEYVSGGKDAAHAKTAATAAYGLMFALPCAVAFAIFPRELIAALYPALGDGELELAAMLLRAQSFNVVLIVATQLSCAALQAMDRARSVMIYMIVGGALRQALQAALIPHIGIVGAPIAQGVMFGTAAVLAALAYRELTGKPSIERKTFAKTALAGVIMVAAETAVSFTVLPVWIKLAAAIAAGAGAYGGVLIATGAVKSRSLCREKATNDTGQNRKADGKTRYADH